MFTMQIIMFHLLNKNNKKNNLAFHCFEVKSNWKLPSWKKIVKTPPARLQIYSIMSLAAANLKE